MSDTYTVDIFNGTEAVFDKKTNLLVRGNDSNYIEEYSQAVLEADEIRRNSPYKDYKPIHLDPTLHTGASSTLLEFEAWKSLYFNDPVKARIAPWTKKEKAYYESLKTKRQRYKYLVIRSGIRSAVIDIPYEAYAGVDENGKLINDEFEELYAIVDSNKNSLKTALFSNEWGIAAGILGNPDYFGADKRHGLNARYIQCIILHMQLTGGSSGFSRTNLLGGIYEYAENILRFGLLGVHRNKIREQEVKKLATTLKPDKFGMLPYIDEIMGVDWVLNFSVHPWLVDIDGEALDTLDSLVDEGELKDPRDKDSTPESRDEFLKDAYARIRKQDAYGKCPSSDWTSSEVQLRIDSLILKTKIAAITPPQSYPNAPTYFAPELMDNFYKRKLLDKKCNPTIPAIYRENFPQYLRQEIEDYARKHNIKD